MRRGVQAGSIMFSREYSAATCVRTVERSAYMAMVWYDSGEPSVLLKRQDELLFGQRVDGVITTTRIRQQRVAIIR